MPCRGDECTTSPTDFTFPDSVQPPTSGPHAWFIAGDVNRPYTASMQILCSRITRVLFTTSVWLCVDSAKLLTFLMPHRKPGAEASPQDS